MKRRKDRYAILDQEVMPWGEYTGKRISRLSVNYCKHLLKTIDQLNPFLRDLLMLRLDKEENWLRELKKDAAFYESLAEEYEAKMLDYKARLDRNENAVELHDAEAASGVERYLRSLRRRFAARYHPDAPEGSAEVMAMINQIFNELETEVRLSSR